MNKKYLALGAALLVMASHMVSAYANPDPDANGASFYWTENRVTGKIYTSPDYQTYYASTGANRRYGFVSTKILLENAETEACIDSNKASGSGLDYVEVGAEAANDYDTYVRVSGIHQVGTSDNNLTTRFVVRKIFTK